MFLLLLVDRRGNVMWREGKEPRALANMCVIITEYSVGNYVLSYQMKLSPQI